MSAGTFTQADLLASEQPAASPHPHAAFAARLHTWLTTRPHLHDQSTIVGPTRCAGAMVPAGAEPPEGITLSTAAAACHLAGLELHVGSLEAVAPSGQAAYIPAKAAQLLGLNEIEAFAVLFTPNATTALGRLQRLTDTQNMPGPVPPEQERAGTPTLTTSYYSC